MRGCQPADADERSTGGRVPACRRQALPRALLVPSGIPVARGEKNPLCHQPESRVLRSKLVPLPSHEVVERTHHPAKTDDSRPPTVCC